MYRYPAFSNIYTHPDNIHLYTLARVFIYGQLIYCLGIQQPFHLYTTLASTHTQTTSTYKHSAASTDNIPLYRPGIQRPTHTLAFSPGYQHPQHSILEHIYIYTDLAFSSLSSHPDKIYLYTHTSPWATSQSLHISSQHPLIFCPSMGPACTLILTSHLAFSSHILTTSTYIISIQHPDTYTYTALGLAHTPRHSSLYMALARAFQQPLPFPDNIQSSLYMAALSAASTHTR